MGTVTVQLGILAIAKDPAHADLADVEIVTSRATAAGHRVLATHVVGDDQAAIREALERWIADPTLDVVIVLGGADSDAVSSAMSPLVGHVLPGFTDLFRYLFFQEAGASAMLSAAEAARCTDTFVFVLPGAVAAAMDKLILPQFDPTTTPKNLVGQMPRLRAERDNAPVATSDEQSAGHGVPREVKPEKTQGGSGVSARLPAMPAPKRDPKRTGANVISRNPAPIDPPTKPIELARLEQEIAASQAKEDVTRRTDLQKLLPKVPPGADELDDDEAGDDVTHADIIAAPPAKPFTIPAIAKPAPIARITPVPAQLAKPADRATPVPTGKTPLPSLNRTVPAKSVEARPVEAKRDSKPVLEPTAEGVAPVTIQPRKRDEANKSAPVPAKPNGAAKHAPEVNADEALTKQRPVVELVDEAVTSTKPRTSGTFGVLSDADLEPIDADSASADLDALRAAATAQSDEAPTVSRAEPVRVKVPTTPPVTLVTAVPPAPAPAAPRTRPPTSPPAPAPRTRPPTSPPAKPTTIPPPAATAADAPRARPATTPPVPRETSELPRGTFNYPVQQRGMHWAIKLLLVLIVLGAGFGGFVFFFREKLTGARGASDGAQQATREIDAAVVATVEVDAAAEPAIDAASDEPEIEMAPTPAGSATQRPPRGERSRTDRTKPPTDKPPPVTPETVDAGVAALPTPPTGPSNTPPGAGDDECDETACVLSKYEKPCCEKYRPVESTDLTVRAGGVPETLDKTMVRTGVNGVKPKVQKCGEKIAVKGTVRVAMTVSPEGAVTDASVADAPDPALGECVVAAMRLAKFGKSVSGAQFTYPFVF